MTARSFLIEKAFTHVKGLTAILTIMAVLGVLFQVAGPFFVGRTINTLTAPSSSFALWYWPALAFISWLTAAATNSLFQALDSYASGRLRMEVQKDFFHALMDADPRAIRSTPGELSSYIREASDSAVSLYNIFTFDIARIIALFVGSSILLTKAHPAMVAVLLAWTVLFTWHFYRCSSRTAMHSSQFSEAKGNLAHHLVDVLSHTDVVRSFAAEAHEKKLLNDVVMAEYSAYGRLKRLLAKLGFDQLASKSVFTAILFMQAVYECAYGRIQVGDIAMILQLSLLITQQVENFSLRVLVLVQNQGALEQALKKAYPPPFRTPASSSDASFPAPRVEFRNVSFFYQSTAMILDRVSFTIEPGEFVAIVGPSGSGKSTVLHILKKRLTCTEGEIYLNGISLKEWPDLDLHRCVKEVNQNTSLFNRGIGENIFYNMETPDLATSKSLIEAVALTDLVERTEEGLSFPVGDRGQRISGGERQRVAIARCLAHPSSLILLDEATSALDEATERKVLNNLRDLTRGKTVLAVTHRLTVAEQADKILEVRDGRVLVRTPRRDASCS